VNTDHACDLKRTREGAWGVFGGKRVSHDPLLFQKKGKTQKKKKKGGKKRGKGGSVPLTS